MMDADALFPKGFHPAVSAYDASSSEIAYPKRRRDVGGVRYYLIDFGISWRFEAGEERKITGMLGQDQDVPELSETVPYDPFLTDVFIIGNLMRKEFVKVCNLLPSPLRLTETFLRDILTWSSLHLCSRECWRATLDFGAPLLRRRQCSSASYLSSQD